MLFTSILGFSAVVFNSGRLRVSPVCVVVMSVGIVDGELSVLLVICLFVGFVDDDVAFVLDSEHGFFCHNLSALWVAPFLSEPAFP